ncbi:amidohydrolase family protein, partial [Geminicoccus flavidas]|uniref:amidohydrolase family protein n=1 Tax=Geminicoccus flavidas TaxID=2506407 RepID=UPI001F2D5677
MNPTRRQTALGSAASTISALLGLAPATRPSASEASTMPADLILVNGRFTTLDRSNPDPQAVAIGQGRFIGVGSEADMRSLAGPSTRIIDLGGRRAVPGLIDSHMHIIRGGLNYNMELRWDGVRSLGQAMEMLRQQVA